MVSFHALFRLLMAAAGLAFGVLALLVFHAVVQHREVSMASFQLHPAAVEWDFRILFGTMVAFGAALAIYGIGGFTASDTLLKVGRLLSLVFSFLPIIVFYRWWRRF